MVQKKRGGQGEQEEEVLERMEVKERRRWKSSSASRGRGRREQRRGRGKSLPAPCKHVEEKKRRRTFESIAFFLTNRAVEGGRQSEGGRAVGRALHEALPGEGRQSQEPRYMNIG